MPIYSTTFEDRHKFLKISKLPELTQEEVGNLNNLKSKEIEFVFINFLTNLQKCLRKVIMPFLHIVFLKTGEQDIFPSSSCENSIALLLKAKTLEENAPIFHVKKGVKKS